MNQTITTQRTRTLSLPFFVTPRNKAIVGFLVGFGGWGLYALTNQYKFFPERLLEMSWVDLTVPMIHETVWIYLTEPFMFLCAFIAARRMDTVNKYVYAFSINWILSNIFFVFYPTIYPRELFPLPEELSTLTLAMFAQMRQIDHPSNCLPSLHVSACFLSALIHFDEGKRKFLFFFAWALAIALSTLTTKQHYLVDIVTGLGSATLAWFVFFRVVKYREN